MDDVYSSRASGFRKASRWIGYGGVIAALLAVGAWLIMKLVVKKESLEDLDVTTVSIKFYPLLAIVIAFVVVVIIVAIALRIASAVNERRALDAAAAKNVGGTLTRASVEKISDASEKLKPYLQTVGAFCKKHIAVIIPSICAVLSIGGLLNQKKKDQKNKPL